MSSFFLTWWMTNVQYFRKTAASTGRLPNGKVTDGRTSQTCCLYVQKSRRWPVDHDRLIGCLRIQSCDFLGNDNDSDHHHMKSAGKKNRMMHDLDISTIEWRTIHFAMYHLRSFIPSCRRGKKLRKRHGQELSCERYQHTNLTFIFCLPY